MGVATQAGLREIDALIKLVKQLSPLPFQKTVLLMGTGLTRPPDQLEYWQSLIRAANRAGVTFYGLDVYGLGVSQDNPNGDGVVAASTTAASTALLQKAAGLSQGQSKAGLGGGPTIGPPPGGQGGGGGPPPGLQTME